MRKNDYFLSIADTAAAGCNNKSDGKHKLLYLVMIPAGNQVINHDDPLSYHLYGCLTALANITGHQDYADVQTYRDIAILVLRDWDVVGSSTYTYRLAADVYRMAEFCGL